MYLKFAGGINNYFYMQSLSKDDDTAFEETT